MLQSKFIADILELLLDGDDAGILKRQVPYLSDAEYDYTISGVFVSFSHAAGIEQHRLDTGRLVLDGVTIESDIIPSGATATLFIKDGLIDFLEIWSHADTYPGNVLKTYTLTQVWKGSKGRKLTVGYT
ncbi:hypothetical protein EGT74_18695 [Chitinophaga lutea]|uniref:Uncharacterized protein n=1 Tax=Chitinophaga lutea TaxID=2488634 RepID=A0A3N4PY87_9BACT|nr:hypothetical protein [Chitinophaga lutea]RPE09037.1 hypothetical protein EGT74_18695 [Chitinophaga lutea]